MGPWKFFKVYENPFKGFLGQPFKRPLKGLKPNPVVKTYSLWETLSNAPNPPICPWP